MKDTLSVAVALAGRRKSLVIGMLTVLIGIVSVSVWYVSTHSRIAGVWHRHIYPDYDERLTLKRADGQEFDVVLTGVKMKDGTVVPYDIIGAALRNCLGFVPSLWSRNQTVRSNEKDCCDHACDLCCGQIILLST